MQAEQHFLDAAGAGGLELLSDSGLQRCVANFDGHGWLLGIKGTAKSGVNQQNPRRDGTVESLNTRSVGHLPNKVLGEDKANLL